MEDANVTPMLFQVILTAERRNYFQIVFIVVLKTVKRLQNKFCYRLGHVVAAYVIMSCSHEQK